jgi:hypothetical protein
VLAEADRRVKRWSSALLTRATVKLLTSVLSIALHSRLLAAFASRTSRALTGSRSASRIQCRARRVSRSVISDVRNTRSLTTLASEATHQPSHQIRAIRSLRASLASSRSRVPDRYPMVVHRGHMRRSQAHTEACARVNRHRFSQRRYLGVQQRITSGMGQGLPRGMLAAAWRSRRPSTNDRVNWMDSNWRWEMLYR